MLNYNLIEERLDQIRVSANRLRKISSLSLEDFLSEPDNYAIAEHHLRRALESLFDIGRHIIAKKGFGKPENYTQIIELLGHHKVLTQGFAKSIIGMAGYRNRLVHEYSKISPEELYDIIKSRLDDFARYCVFIVEFLDNNEAN